MPRQDKEKFPSNRKILFFGNRKTIPMNWLKTYHLDQKWTSRLVGACTAREYDHIAFWAGDNFSVS
jgi:hypothetical protein